MDFRPQRRISILSGVLVALLAGAHEAVAATLPGMDAVAMATASLAAGLNDPSSVQYRSVGIVTKKAGTNTVCGEYNARNSYGGYDGFRFFLAPASNPSLVEPNVSPETWTRLCVTDENAARLNAAAASAMAKAAAERDRRRNVRREDIERTCAETRQVIEDGGGPDVQRKQEELARSCAELIRKSDAS